MLPCIFEEGSRLKTTLAFCTCSNIKIHREEKDHCSFIAEVRTHLKNLEGASMPASHCCPLFHRLPFADENTDINNSFCLFICLFQAVLADLSTLKVMPLLQIFLFATVTWSSSRSLTTQSFSLEANHELCKLHKTKIHFVYKPIKIMFPP